MEYRQGPSGEPNPDDPQVGWREPERHTHFSGAIGVGQFRLRLYIAGDTPVSQRARYNLERLCQRHSFSIEPVVIDILREPSLADDARIFATPTLVYEQPTRSKRVIGDLGDTDKVIEFLGLQQSEEQP